LGDIWWVCREICEKHRLADADEDTDPELDVRAAKKYQQKAMEMGQKPISNPGKKISRGSGNLRQPF
jgi:hypothetical protein